MKDLWYRFWNTIKLPLIAVIVSSIYNVVNELQVAGDFSTIVTLDFWIGHLYIVAIMVLPALGATLDKWLRGEGFYVEQVFNRFNKPE
jgi:hypothetical protein